MKSNINNSTKDFIPKGYLIRYPFLVNECIARFINDFQDDFTQDKKGRFVLRKFFSKTSLETLFVDYLKKEQDRLLSEAFYKLSPSLNVWIIIADSGSDRRASFEMAENDIDIHLNKIEKALESIFNKLMLSKHVNPNIVYCRHNSLLSTDWKEILEKKVFGKKNLIAIDHVPEKTVVIEKTNELDPSKEKSSSLIVKECVFWLQLIMQR